MEIKEGMYVRTKLTDFCNLIAIRRIIEIDEDANEIWLDDDVIDDYGELCNTVRKEDIDKASNYIIDLIEVGDYVNGLLVTRIFIDEETNKKYINLYGSVSEWEEEDIKTILTKEQFESQKYIVESE